MIPTQSQQHVVDTLGKSTVLYDTIERWCREFQCGRQSCTDEYDGGAPTIVTIQGTVKNDLVLQDLRVIMRQLAEENGFLYRI
ncbi:hypothetical protein Trydic_g13596 [Trypoxylus dichotomus]